MSNFKRLNIIILIIYTIIIHDNVSAQDLNKSFQGFGKAAPELNGYVVLLKDNSSGSMYLIDIEKNERVEVKLNGIFDKCGDIVYIDSHRILTRKQKEKNPGDVFYLYNIGGNEFRELFDTEETTGETFIFDMADGIFYDVIKPDSSIIMHYDRTHLQKKIVYERPPQYHDFGYNFQQNAVFCDDYFSSRPLPLWFADSKIMRIKWPEKVITDLGRYGGDICVSAKPSFSFDGRYYVFMQNGLNIENTDNHQKNVKPDTYVYGWSVDGKLLYYFKIDLESRKKYHWMTEAMNLPYDIYVYSPYQNWEAKILDIGEIGQFDRYKVFIIPKKYETYKLIRDNMIIRGN